MPPHLARPDRPPAAPPAAERDVTSSPAAAAVLLALTLLVRLPAYAVNENDLGDAVSRTELARKWADAPHWISSFTDGAYQYGPLHLYVVGAALKLGVPAERAGPLTSLLFGTLTALPLWALTRRLFGGAAAAWSGVALALWGLHIQMSTTGASEALSLFLVLGALALFHPERPRRLAASGLVLTLACAVRYDTWLLAPLLSLLALAHGKDLRAAFGRAALFGLCCLPFPVAWLWGNARDLGDPLYPLHYVEAFQREWLPEGLRRWGQVLYRLQNLGFWPGVAVVTLGPLAGGAGMFGMGWAYRARPDVRWLLWAAWAPAAYFTFRGAVLVDFQPLARYAVTQVALVLPFLKPGADALLRGRRTRAAAALGAASMIGVTAFLAAYTWEPRTRPARALYPVGPISRNPLEVRQVLALFTPPRVEDWQPLLLDEDPRRYLDIQIGFSLRHPWPERVVHRRWPTWEEALTYFQPVWIVRFEGGLLETSPRVEVKGTSLRLDRRWYDEVPGVSPPVHLYRAR
ncbi:MAG TPA: glycosyltransferase family 39 protein [Myxococcales bacterium]|nr:glycosyltransferase family 39 protein [Myxococcales bacterium]